MILFIRIFAISVSILIFCVFAFMERTLSSRTDMDLILNGRNDIDIKKIYINVKDKWIEIGEKESLDAIRGYFNKAEKKMEYGGHTYSAYIDFGYFKGGYFAMYINKDTKNKLSISIDDFYYTVPFCQGKTNELKLTFDLINKDINESIKRSSKNN